MHVVLTHRTGDGCQGVARAVGKEFSTWRASGIAAIADISKSKKALHLPEGQRVIFTVSWQIWGSVSKPRSFILPRAQNQNRNEARGVRAQVRACYAERLMYTWTRRAARTACTESPAAFNLQP